MARGRSIEATERARFRRSMALAFVTHLLALGAAVVFSPRAADAGPQRSGELLVEAPPVAAPSPKQPEPAPEPERNDPAPPAAALKPPADFPYDRSPDKPQAPVAEAQKILTTDDPSADTGEFASGEGTGFGMVAGAGRGKGRGGLDLGVPGGTGTGSRPPPPPPPPDRSRVARVIDVSADNCEFPDDAGDVNSAVVTVQVPVGTDGRPAGVSVLRTPSRSFARAAQQCAQRRLYQAALDRDGHKVPGRTGPLTVRFIR